MSDTTTTRTAAGTTIPVGTYQIDPSHSSAAFQVRHLGLSKVRGSFDRFTGTVVVDDDPARSSVEVALEAASFTTGDADRDGHVKGGDFLDVEQFPTLTYRSTGVRADGGNWVVEGELTIKDVTLPVPLTVEFEGAGDDPWGNARLGFSATAEFNRDDFGITWNQALETGGVLVGKQVKVLIDVELVAQAPEQG
jgi:polyisoprenoid-binding protein YceI